MIYLTSLHCTTHTHSHPHSLKHQQLVSSCLCIFLPSFFPPSALCLPCFPSYFISRFSSTCVSQIRAQSHPDSVNQSAALLSLGLCMFCLYKPIKIVTISMQQFSQLGISQWCVVCFHSFLPEKCKFVFVMMPECREPFLVNVAMIRPTFPTLFLLILTLTLLSTAHVITPFTRKAHDKHELPKVFRLLI